MPVRLRLHAAAAVFTFLAAALALTVLGLLTLNGAQAANTQPNCGDTITADTRLDGDLVDCPNNGIVIGADDITLDLNGHRIDGDGTPAAGCNPRKEPCDIGVANDGHDGVTVKRGSLRDFGIGVFVVGARDNRVLDVSSKQNEFFGFAFGNVARSLVRDSSGSDNIAPEGDGMGVFGSHDLRIVDNTFRNNPGPGIHVEDSDDNLIKGNRFSHNSPAILMEADRNRVRRNRFDRNDGGVIVSGRRNVVERNRLSRDGHGIAIEKGRHNLVARNVVIHARSKGHQPRTRLCRRDFDRRGRQHRPPKRGQRERAAMGSWSTRGVNNLLKRNVARGAKEDGFDVESRSTKLTKNRARRNADLGIDAVQGVVDGGGNRARGNGDGRQCVNVKCH